MRTIIIAAAIAAAGCKGKDPARPPLTSTAPADEAALGPATRPDGEVLHLAAARLNAGSDGALAIDAAGKVAINGKAVGTLSPSGEFTSGGAVIATIAPDGTVAIEGWGPGLQLSVRADGALLDQGEVALELRPDGTLGGPYLETEPGLQGVKLTLEGDQAGYRALMFAWAVVAKSDRLQR